jgi:hypothetical protein
MSDGWRAADGPPDVSGVYVVEGPAGIYVGESEDCYARNWEFTRLGIPWRVVKLMPGASRKEREKVERETAEAYRSRGLVVVSKHKNEPEFRIKCRTRQLDKKRTPEARAKTSRSVKRSWRNPKTRAMRLAGLARSREALSRAGVKANHNRWHVRQRVSNPACTLCREAAA